MQALLRSHFKSGTLAILTVVDVLIAADPLALMLVLNSVGIANKANLSSPLTLTEEFNAPVPFDRKSPLVDLSHCLAKGHLLKYHLYWHSSNCLKFPHLIRSQPPRLPLVVVNRYKLTKLMLVNKENQLSDRPFVKTFFPPSAFHTISNPFFTKRWINASKF